MPKKNILVVEDEVKLSQALKHFIDKLGHTTLLAKNGLEAEEIIENNEIDLVLLDLLMPVKDGYEFLEDMRNAKKLDSLSVVVITNYDVVFQREDLIKLGVKDYMIKSNFDLDEVESLIKKYA